MAHSQQTPASEDVEEDIPGSSSKRRKIDDLALMRKTLQQSTKLLCDNLKAEDILIDLQTKEVLSTENVQNIQHQITDSKKVETLLDILRRKPLLHYVAFTEVLKKVHADLYSSIKEIEKLNNFCPSAEIADDQLHHNLKVCKEELIKSYKREMSKVQLLPWCDDTIDMDDIYVSLELEEQSYRGTSKLEKNEDLVTLKTRQDMPATRVLVKGVAGSGKSTLLARLAYNWAQQSSDSPLAKFELLFMISLREMGRDSSLIDAIFQQILAYDTMVSKDNLLTYIKSHSKSIIILFDGFDEHKTKNLLKEQNGINGVLTFKFLRDCRVILSTRPYVHLCIEHQSHYISVKLTGFSEESVRLYLIKFFDGDTDMVDGLSRRLSESEMLSSLSTTPVMLMLMCLLWEDEQKLPDTQSELYQEFTLYLWRKYCIKQGIEFDVEGSCGGEEFIKHILGLGRVALAGLCSKGNTNEEKLVFTERDFDQSSGLCDVGCSIGLLTRERLRSRLNRYSAVTFLHKSFQEFCAAKYWASLIKPNPDEFYATLMKIKTWDTLIRKIEMLKFCCGVVHNIGAISIVHHGLRIYKTECCHTSRVIVGNHNPEKGIHDIAPILTLLYESKFFSNNLGVKNLILTENNHMVNQSFQHLANIDDFNETLRSIFTGSELNVHSSPQTMSMFHYFVKSTCGLSLTSVKSFTIDVLPLPEDSWDVIGDAFVCMPQLQEIGIVFCPSIPTPSKTCLSLDHFKHFCKQLTKLSKLRVIEVAGTTQIQVQVELGAGARVTTLPGIGLTPDIVASILDAIQSKIEKVFMLFINVADAISHVKHIMTPHLQILDLQNAKLGEDHIKVLSDFLPRASNLHELNLEGNTLEMAVVYLADQLQYCTRLSKLSLRSTWVTDKACIELAQRFTFLLNLSVLDIGFNDVKNTGAHFVLKNLHHLTKLQVLDINAQVDNQCSALVKECVTAIANIGKTIPDTGFLDICTEFGYRIKCEDITLICAIGRKYLE